MPAKNSLSVKLLSLTAKTIWERGQNYADDQLVGDIWRENDKIIAHVDGTKRYLVKLTTKG